MTALVIDASVWVAAADATDSFSVCSRDFLAVVAVRRLPLALPALARIEVACALARRLRNASAACRLTDGLFRSPLVRVYALDEVLIDEAVLVGTDALLCAADAVYLTLAQKFGATIVARDAELVRRGTGMAPED